MPLMTLNQVHLAFGAKPVLDNVDLQIHRGDRVCLLGRNGEGKSSLMKVLAGQIEPDSGEVRQRQGLKVGHLAQDVPSTGEGTVFQVVARGDDHFGQRLAEYHQLEIDQAPPEKLAQVQGALEDQGWLAYQRVEKVLNRLHLHPDEPFAKLSGGLKRRVLLARALVEEPDLLLLDEPTNHLDLESIQWLEEFLTGSTMTLLFVSHDRSFLQNLATRIVELDRGVLRRWDCSYAQYEQRRDDFLAAQEQQYHKQDRKLAQEEAWIRQGIKARRTRNEGRVRALKKLREEHANRRDKTGTAQLTLQEGVRSGRIIAEAEDLCFSYGQTEIIHRFTGTILRGDKIGLIGPNGIGKSTLLKLLLGQLEPTAGQLHRGTRQEIVYFDQLRGQLDREKTVIDNIADGTDFIEVNGQRRHVIGYLQDFLFEPSRVRQPVKVLSGGEKNRLLLARLFTRPANVLVMDEPTNDLDMETLELLESLLVEFSGTLLLVSHDRTFLNHVVTKTFVFEGKGVVQQYAGGYDDWCAQRKKQEPSATTNPKSTPATKPSRRTARLGYKEKIELADLPATIEKLEQKQQELQQNLAAPEVFKDHLKLKQVQQDLSEIEHQLENRYQRWEELETKAENE